MLRATPVLRYIVADRKALHVVELPDQAAERPAHLARQAYKPEYAHEATGQRKRQV